MKRTWDSNQAQQLFTKLQQSQQKTAQQANANAAAGSGSSSNSTSTAAKSARGGAASEGAGGHWLDMNNHPYASAYANMSSSSLLTGNAPFSGAGSGGSGNDAKRARSTKDDEDSDEDDDDDDSDDDNSNQKLAAQAAKPNRKIVKGPDGKPKVKLTRGSRACIA